MIRAILGFILAWLTVRIIRSVLAFNMVGSQAKENLDMAGKTHALELVVCPKCGVYTAMPCTNPDCR